MYYFINRSLLRLAPILYMIFIWLQSSYFDPGLIGNLPLQISSPVLIIIGISFEFAHLFEFGLLYLSLFIAFLSFGEINRGREIVAFSISFIFGLIDEIHQIFVPFRSFSVVDVIKNTIGIFVMWWVIHKSYFKNKKSRVGLILRKISSSI